MPFSFRTLATSDENNVVMRPFAAAELADFVASAAASTVLS